MRNQIRIHRLSMTAVTEVCLRRKLSIWALGPQLVGYITTRDESVVVEASRSLLSPHGRVFSQPKDTTRRQMTQLASYIGVDVKDFTSSDSAKTA